MSRDSPYRLEREATSTGDWSALLATADFSAVEQCASYGAAMAATHKVACEYLTVRRGETPVALALAFRRRWLGAFTLVRIVRGPVWLEPPEARETVDILRAIRGAYRRARGDILSWIPELPDDAASIAAMRAIGMRRMVTGYSSVWLDLAPDPDALRAGLDGKWRNALVAAERTGLAVEATRGGPNLADLVARYDAFRRARRFIGPEGKLIRAIAEAARNGRRTDRVTIVTGHEKRELAAGIVLVRHGNCATYLAGWTGEAGRRANAHNLLLWRGIERLRADGVRRLDLGGLDAVRTPGIARFKLGLGGELFTLSGSYL